MGMDGIGKICYAIFGLIIITILVYSWFKDGDDSETSFIPEPPSTSLEPIPFTEGFGNEEEEDEEEEDDCTYSPYESHCTTSKYAATYTGLYESKNVQEGFQEGMVQLSDFMKFLDFIFDMIEDMIYLVLTLPEHILSFAYGFYYIMLAGADLFINFIEELAQTFEDIGTLLSDIFRCGFNVWNNILWCMFWYAIEFIIYMFVWLFVWLPIELARIITFGKLDLNPLYLFIFGVKGFKDIGGGKIAKDGIFAKISHVCYKITGYEFMHFPDKVIRTCYGCDFVGDIMNLFYDFTIGVLRMFETPMKDVAKSAPYFWHALYMDSIFGSV
jgi:hypothetical protein